MRAFRHFVLGCLVLGLGALGCGKKESPEVKEQSKVNKEKLLGTWDVVKTEGEGAFHPGVKAVLFTKEFGLRMKPLKKGTKRVGYEVVEGNKLKITTWKEKSALGDSKTLTIKTLDDTTLVLVDDKGKTQELKKRGTVTAATEKEKLLGDWIVVKSEGGWQASKDGFSPGDQVKFDKNDFVALRWKQKNGLFESAEVKYALKGDKLTLGADDKKQTVTILELTDALLITETEDGKTDEFRKKYRDPLSRAHQKKIVGTWVVEKNDGHLDWPPVGSTVEFTSDGKFKPGLKRWSNATYKIDAKTLELTQHQEDGSTGSLPTIESLTADTLTLQGVQLKRKK